MKVVLETATLAALLVLSAFFSVSETSLFSLRPWRVERLRREQPRSGDAVARFLADPLRLLVTLVVGAELVTIVAGNLTAIIRRDHLSHLGEYGVVLSLAATSALLLLLGEITPKSLAAVYPEWSAALVARPLAAVQRVLSPVVAPLALLAARFPVGRWSKDAEALTETDFRLMVEVGMREGVLDRREVEMIGAVFRIGDLPVRSVMVPRTDMQALPASAAIPEALAHIRRHRHSRVPLFDGDLDHIVGVLYAKDLLGAREDAGEAREVRALARPAFFVPEMMRAKALIREFQSRRLHLAVVVDEYGGTSGIVSLEDLLEEIVGDIADDFDKPLTQYRPVRRGLDWARGSLPFTEFKRKFRARARPGAYDTLGGYLLRLFGRFPSEGEQVSDGQFAYTAFRMGRRRVLEVMIERGEPREMKGPGSPPGPSKVG